MGKHGRVKCVWHGGTDLSGNLFQNRLGNPLRLTLTGGQRHDVTQAPALLAGWQPQRVKSR
ncbi:MAG: hypothetical protein HC933_00055 [Pleurocapsa sp. SU_196_0]|nr:hypothetical protein [Pleurocapsa sp. SU_196_0]